MKKITKLLIAVLFLIISITPVDAKSNIFELGWIKKINSNISNIEYIGFTNKIAYGEGYIITSVTSLDSNAGTKIVYYSNKGEVIKENVINKKNFISLKEYEDSIYAVAASEAGMSQESPYYELIKLNSNLDIISEVNIEIGDNEELIYLPMIIKYAGIDFISTVNNQITVLGLTYNDITLHHFDKDLKKHVIKILKNNEEDIKYGTRYYPIAEEFYNLMELSNEGLNPDKLAILSDIKNNLKVYNGADLSKCGLLFSDEEFDEENPPQCYINSKLKLTGDNNVVFDKNFEDYIVLIDAKIVDNYIVAIGIKNIGNITDLLEKVMSNRVDEIKLNLQSEIVVLNMKGEIVQTIGKQNNFYLGITPSTNGFVVNKVSLKVPLLSIINGTVEENVNFDLLVESYELPKNIVTKVTGKGDILVNEKKFQVKQLNLK